MSRDRLHHYQKRTFMRINFGMSLSNWSSRAKLSKIVTDITFEFLAFLIFKKSKVNINRIINLKS